VYLTGKILGMISVAHPRNRDIQWHVLPCRKKP